MIHKKYNVCVNIKNNRVCYDKTNIQSNIKQMSFNGEDIYTTRPNVDL